MCGDPPAPQSKQTHHDEYRSLNCLVHGAQCENEDYNPICQLPGACKKWDSETESTL